MSSRVRDRCLLRLAQVFEVHYVDLRREYLDLLQYASSVVQQGRTTCQRTAWQLAYLKTRERWMRTRHSTNALFPVLCRYFTFCGATTSGVEQTWSVLGRVTGPNDNRKQLNPRQLEFEFRIHLWGPNRRGRTIAASAAEVATDVEATS